MSMPLLQVRDLQVHYGSIHALKGVSLEIHAGEMVTLIGSNGAGKSTLLKAISGMQKPTSGAVVLQGVNLTGCEPRRAVRQGIAHVPEGRGIFGNLTVAGNLSLGAYLRSDKAAIRDDFAMIYSLFPLLAERSKQLAGTLSGGEQQMLAIGRGLMMRPKILLLDEPSLGLAPLLVQKIFEILKTINANGCTILLVEQNANLALKTAHRGYVLDTGLITLQDSAEALLSNQAVRQAYLGG